MNSEIAFVFYPHAAEKARLETMPFAINLINAIAESGHPIDLFVWEMAPTKAYSEYLHENVSVILCRSSFRDFVQKLGNIQGCGTIQDILNRILFTTKKNYSCLFCLGQPGAYIAESAMSGNRIPLVYVNDEFPSHWANTRYSKIERSAAKRAVAIVAPDLCRKTPLYKELEISSETPFAELPNFPKQQCPTVQEDWHTRLGIDKDKHMVLNAGTISDWTQVPEILSTVPYWPENAVLVLNSRSKDAADLAKQLEHLHCPDKVFWNIDPLGEQEINSLVQAASCCFGLYRNTGPNIEYIGKSSGKIMRSISLQTPVIASNFESLSFVESENLGALVTHPREIPGAIGTILEDLAAYRNQCRIYSDENLNFQKIWSEVSESLSGATNLKFS